MAAQRRRQPGQIESLSDQAYFSIREFILRGEFPLGAPLSRRRLALRLHMSLLPVSEALQRLEREGFVETRPRAGTRVRMPTRRDVAEQYVIREALETQSARLLSELGTPSQFRELRRLAERIDLFYDRLKSTGEDDSEFTFSVHMQHFEFHMRLAEFTGCTALYREIESKQVLMLNWLYMVAVPGRDLPRNFHRELIEAIASGDVERADHEMRRHVRYGLPELLRRIEAKDVQGWRQSPQTTDESAGEVRFEKQKPHSLRFSAR